MDDTDRVTLRLWRINKTVKEMVRDRGYYILQEEIDIPLDEFKAKICDAMGQPQRKMMSFQANPVPEAAEKYGDLGPLYVDFCDESGTISVDIIKSFCLHVSEKNISTGIFIYQDGISSSAHKIIPTVEPATIETFKESDLIVNITHHELVPKHLRLSTAEKAELLSRYRLKESQLPRIQREDPVARYMGLKRGQVVKIIRRSETAGRYASYRICL